MITDRIKNTVKSTTEQLPMGSDNGGGSNVSWPFVIGGGTLVVMAIRGGAIRGVLMAGAGGALAYRGVKGTWPWGGAKQPSPSMHATVTINKPREELFDLWRDLESLPHLVPRLDDVASHGEKSKWEVSSMLGGKMQWRAEITDEDRPSRIAWRTTADSDVPMTGTVRFDEAAGGRGTQVRVDIDPEPPGGKIGATLAAALAKAPEQQLRMDLRQLKQRLEAGEIATTEGQPRGAGDAMSTSDGAST